MFYLIPIIQNMFTILELSLRNKKCFYAKFVYVWYVFILFSHSTSISHVCNLSHVLPLVLMVVECVLRTAGSSFMTNEYSLSQNIKCIMYVLIFEISFIIPVLTLNVFLVIKELLFCHIADLLSLSCLSFLLYICFF